MEIIKITPRGYCKGVVHAISAAKKAAKNPKTPRPISVLGMIVHNDDVIEELSKLGITTIDKPGATRRELLELVTSGTVVFSAHGTDPKVIQEAIDRNLNVIDASCEYVIKTQELILSELSNNNTIVYIGKHGHPETESALSLDPQNVLLVENNDDILNLNIDEEKNITITNQTTVGLWDTLKLVDKIKDKYPTANYVNEICNATSSRQEAVAEQAVGCDLTIVIGDPKSNNTRKLVDISETKAKVPAVRIANLSELNDQILVGKDKIAVTAGASTPTRIMNEVIEYLEKK